jgi:hypothetical protein
MINMENRDYDYVNQVASEKELGGKGFSAAVRLIIREHQSEHDQPPVYLTISPRT